MEMVVNAWNKLMDMLSGMVLWHWIVVGGVALFVLQKSAKRYLRRQVRKTKQLVMRLVRLYFIGM